MDNRRQFPRIIVLNLKIQLRAANGDLYEVVNVSEGGLCLQRRGGVRIGTGTPIKAHLSWPEKRIEKDLSGHIVWSRVYDDGDAFYGMAADVDWLMEAVGPYKPQDVEPEEDLDSEAGPPGKPAGGPKA